MQGLFVISLIWDSLKEIFFVFSLAFGGLQLLHAFCLSQFFIIILRTVKQPTPSIVRRHAGCERVPYRGMERIFKIQSS